MADTAGNLHTHVTEWLTSHGIDPDDLLELAATRQSLSGPAPMIKVKLLARDSDGDLFADNPDGTPATHTHWLPVDDA